MQAVTIGSNQAGQRLDKFLHKCLPEAGSSFLYKMLRKKNITLNGKKAEGKEMLSEGDEVKFFFSEETFQKFSGQSPYEEYKKAYQTLKGIELLYEDEQVLFLNKPAGILSQKAEAGDKSINEWMLGYLLSHDEKTKADFATFRPSVCNRLDRNTSGLVLCGKSLSGSQILSQMIRERSLQKFYYTICAGEIKKSETLEGYLIKTGNHVSIQKCATNDDKSSYIKTAYKPLRIKDGYTLLEVELITGKSHQIRAHLASFGHPIIGDFKYGDRTLNKKFQDKYNLQYQLLHAHHVVFPEDAEILNGKTFTADVPKQFREIQEALGL